MKRLIALLVLIGLGLAWAAPGPALALDESCFRRLIVSSVVSEYKLKQCLEAQQEGFQRHAATAEGAKYLFRIARLNDKLHQTTGRRENLRDAEAAYRRLVHDYPKSSLADDALYYLANLLLKAKHDRVGAYVELLRIEVAYPRGDMIEQAKKERSALAGEIKKQTTGTEAKAEDKAGGQPRPQADSAPAPPAVPTGSDPATGRGNGGDPAEAPSGTPHIASSKINPRSEETYDPPPEEPAPEITGRETEVTGLRHWSTGDYTRVVVDLTGPVKFTSRMLKPDPELKKPARLYLDLKPARLGGQGEKVAPIADDHLRRARLGQFDANTVRLVLDIEDINGYKAFLLHSPTRLVVDVSGPQAVASAKGQPRPQSKPKPTIAADPRKGSGQKVPRGKAKREAGPGLAAQLGLGVETVVIDPGHGGRDPGARTCKGVKEKRITLAIAQKLAGLLRSKLGLKVILTRSKDVFVPLEERTAIANTHQADLFVSIHVNAARNRRLHGVETYFLNLATNKRAITLAARENATSTKSISDLESILNDLMLNTKINESNRLAFQVQRSVVGRLRRTFPKTRSLGVKQAPFYVLLGARMPAVLIEVGFGSNPTECYRLGKDRYLTRIATGLYEGLAAYINQTKSGG